MQSIHFISRQAVKSKLRMQSVKIVNTEYAGRVVPRIEFRLVGRSPEHQSLIMTTTEAESLGRALVRTANELNAKNK